MEGAISFKAGNSQERGALSLVLNNKDISAPMWGRSIKAAIEDLVRVYAVAKHLAEKGVKSKAEIHEVAQDLFEEFGVKIFDFDSIFTDDVVNQIVNANTITDLSLSFHGHPVKITSGVTAESVMSPLFLSSRFSAPFPDRISCGIGVSRKRGRNWCYCKIGSWLSACPL